MSDQTPSDSNRPSPGSAEFAAALIYDEQLRCRHPQKYRVDTNGEPVPSFPYPSCLGFFHGSKTGTSVSCLDLSKLCRSCCDKAVPNGYYNVWSVLAGSSPGDVAEKFASLKASGDFFPLVLEAGTESSSAPKTIPIPDVAGASKIWQWLQSQAQPFYIDQLHLLRTISPMVRKKAAKDSAIAIKYGMSFTVAPERVEPKRTAGLDVPSMSSEKPKKSSSKTRSTKSRTKDTEIVDNIPSAVKEPAKKDATKKTALSKGVDASKDLGPKSTVAAIPEPQSKLSAIVDSAPPPKEKAKKMEKSVTLKDALSLKTIGTGGPIDKSVPTIKSSAPKGVTEGIPKIMDPDHTTKVTYTKTWGWYDPYLFNSPARSPALSDFLRVAEARRSTADSAPETRSLENYLQQHLKLEETPRLLGPGDSSPSGKSDQYKPATKGKRELSSPSQAHGKLSKIKEVVGSSTIKTSVATTGKAKAKTSVTAKKATEIHSSAEKSHVNAKVRESAVKTEKLSNSKNLKDHQIKGEKQTKINSTVIKEKVSKKTHNSHREVFKSTVQKKTERKDPSHGSLAGVGSALLGLAEKKIKDAASKSHSDKKHKKPKPHVSPQKKPHSRPPHHQNKPHSDDDVSDEETDHQGDPPSHSSPQPGASLTTDTPSDMEDHPVDDSPNAGNLPEPGTSMQADIVIQPGSGGFRPDDNPDQPESLVQSQESANMDGDSQLQTLAPPGLNSQNVQPGTASPGNFGNGSGSNDPSLPAPLVTPDGSTAEDRPPSGTQPIHDAPNPSIPVKLENPNLQEPSTSNPQDSVDHQPSNRVDSQSTDDPKPEPSKLRDSANPGEDAAQTLPSKSLSSNMPSKGETMSFDNLSKAGSIKKDGTIISNNASAENTLAHDINGLTVSSPPQEERNSRGGTKVLLAGAAVIGAVGAASIAAGLMEDGDSSGNEDLEDDLEIDNEDVQDDYDDNDGPGTSSSNPSDNEDDPESDAGDRADDDHSSANGDEGHQSDGDEEPEIDSQVDEDSDNDEPDIGVNDPDDENDSDRNEDQEKSDDEGSEHGSEDGQLSDKDDHDSSDDESDKNDGSDDEDDALNSDDEPEDDLSDESNSDKENDDNSGGESDYGNSSDDGEGSDDDNDDEEDRDEEPSDNDDGENSDGGSDDEDGSDEVDAAEEGDEHSENEDHDDSDNRSDNIDDSDSDGDQDSGGDGEPSDDNDDGADDSD